MFDSAPQVATFTVRVEPNSFWEWFKNLFSRKQASHLNMDYLIDSPADELDSDKPAASHEQIAAALRPPKNNCMKMGSPLTPGKGHQNPWDDDEPQPVVEMAAKNWLFSKLAALVLAIGKFIKNAANAIREHVESSSKQYEESVKAFGKTPMRGI